MHDLKVSDLPAWLLEIWDQDPNSELTLIRGPNGELTVEVWLTSANFKIPTAIAEATYAAETDDEEDTSILETKQRTYGDVRRSYAPDSRDPMDPWGD